MKYETTYGERSPDAAPLVRAHPGHDGHPGRPETGRPDCALFPVGKLGNVWYSEHPKSAVRFPTKCRISEAVVSYRKTD